MRTGKILSRHHPWLAAAIGGVLGVLCQRSFRDDPSAKAGEPRSGPSRSAATAAAAPLASGRTTARIREISKATAGDCEARVREIFGWSTRGMEIELEALFLRWLSFEKPEEILSRLNMLKNSTRSDWNAAFFHAWVALDEQAAMADTRYSQLNQARALFAVRHADPEFARYFVNTSHLGSFENKAQAALTTLARERPDIARLVAEADFSSDLKSKCIAAVARGWAMSNPKEALAWLTSSDIQDADSALAAVFSEWLKTDPDAATEARERLGLADWSIGNGSIASQALGAMGRPDAASSQLFIALHRDPFLGLTTLHQELSAMDLDWEKPGYLMAAINHDGWYGVDPADDAKKAEELPAGKARDFIMSAICQNWAAHDPDAALRYADAHGIKSPETEHLREQPTEEMRQSAFAAPEKTFAALMGDSDLREGVTREQLHKLAEEWSAADPVAAAKWLVTQDRPERDEPGGLGASLLFSNTLGYYWANNDPLGASRWMESLPDGPGKARAWEAMAHYVNAYSPDLAFALSAAYAGEENRQSLLTKELEDVRKHIGYPAAAELLKSPHLSDEERDVLANALEAQNGGTK